ncbi:MAG: TetR/AcrR family transcriptional regulator [Saprospiraceae bacterium]
MMIEENIATLNIPTEEKIMRAATRVFTRRGYDGTTTRDIAEVAGINVATLHYYHRKKEDLFRQVAETSMREFVQIHTEIFSHPLPLREKIYAFVDRYTEMFEHRPHLALFCVLESERTPESFHELVDFHAPHRVLTKQLEGLYASGEIRKISPQQFLNALVGMTIYPFITKGTILTVNEMDEAGFSQMLQAHKRMVPEMIINYVFVK